MILKQIVALKFIWRSNKYILLSRFNWPQTHTFTVEPRLAQYGSFINVHMNAFD